MDNEGDDELGEELSGEEPPTQSHISTFLRLPQEIVTRNYPICEPIVTYFQSQILTLDLYVEILESISQRKKELGHEKERKMIEKKLTK